jgi:hypothetical protein
VIFCQSLAFLFFPRQSLGIGPDQERRITPDDAERIFDRGLEMQLGVDWQIPETPTSLRYGRGVDGPRIDAFSELSSHPLPTVRQINAVRAIQT